MKTRFSPLVLLIFVLATLAFWKSEYAVKMATRDIPEAVPVETDHARIAPESAAAGPLAGLAPSFQPEGLTLAVRPWGTAAGEAPAEGNLEAPAGTRLRVEVSLPSPGWVSGGWIYPDGRIQVIQMPRLWSGTAVTHSEGTPAVPRGYGQAGMSLPAGTGMGKVIALHHATPPTIEQVRSQLAAAARGATASADGAPSWVGRSMAVRILPGTANGKPVGAR